jgi:hypothetical protein
VAWLSCSFLCLVVPHRYSLLSHTALHHWRWVLVLKAYISYTPCFLFFLFRLDHGHIPLSFAFEVVGSGMDLVTRRWQIAIKRLHG